MGSTKLAAERRFFAIKKPDGPLLNGYRIYQTYTRPHMGLNGRTSAEVAGIEVKGGNKWLTLIQNASKESRLARST